MNEGHADLRAFIEYRVREGFESEREIIEDATEFALGRHGRRDLQPEVERITAELLAVHRREQARWESPTDCDCLDEAFASLNRQGIIARQDFSCCTPCGHRDMEDEIAEVEKHQVVDGYVFYHFHCTETAMKTGELLLAYGAIEEGEEALVRVAKTIVRELQRVGLDATWGGNDRHPIVVHAVVWRRRR